MKSEKGRGELEEKREAGHRRDWHREEQATSNNWLLREGWDGISNRA